MKNNIKVFALAVAIFIVFSTIAFVSCNKEAESKNESSLISESEAKKVDKLVFGIYIKSTKTLNYGLDFEDIAYAVEKYTEEKLDKAIVFEQAEIIDFKQMNQCFTYPTLT